MPQNESLDRSCRLRASHQAGSAPRWVSLTGGNPVNSSVSLRRVGAYYPASVPKVHKNQDERSTGVASLCEVCLFSRWL